MTDRIEEIRARCEKAIAKLRALLPPQVDYAELVCAEGFAHGQHYVWTEPEPYAMDDAATLLEYMISQLAERDKEIERLREAVAWIPVSERLPNKTSGVLVVNKYRQVHEALFDNYHNQFIYFGEIAIVTHWMPLPSPPEESNAD